jgi:hypothetical protein
MITQKKRKIKDNQAPFLKIIFVFLIIIIIFILFYSKIKLTKKIQELNLAISGLQKEINNLTLQNREIEKTILQKEDQDFQEREARIRFNLKKKGEEVLIVVSASKDKESSEKQNFPETQEVAINKSFWQKIFDFVSKIFLFEK